MKKALWAVPKWFANRPQAAWPGISTCCSAAPGAALSMPRTSAIVNTRGSSGVHRVRFAVMCPSAVPISSTRLGRACSSSVSTARVSSSRVNPQSAPRTSGRRNRSPNAVRLTDTTRLGMEECVDKYADSISPARGTNDHDEENCDPTAGRDLPLSKNASDSFHLSWYISPF